MHFVFRTVFFRTVELLKLGLRPVFVLDGQAPTVKYNTLDQRRSAAGYSSGSGDRSRVRYREIANKVFSNLVLESNTGKLLIRYSVI